MEIIEVTKEKKEVQDTLREMLTVVHCNYEANADSHSIPLSGNSTASPAYQVVCSLFFIVLLLLMNFCIYYSGNDDVNV
jgi:hypothetical protein